MCFYSPPPPQLEQELLQDEVELQELPEPQLVQLDELALLIFM
jgi:hypothetical protein